MDTSLVVAPDTGWTAGGDGTATIASGVITLEATDVQTGARLTRTAPSSGFLPAVEVMARVTLTQLPVGGAQWQGIAVTTPSVDRGYLVQVDQTDNVFVFWNNAGVWTYQTNVVAVASWASGNLWLRAVCSPAFCTLYHGAGVGDAVPAAWSTLFTFDTDSPSMATVIGLGLLTDVAAFCGRAGGVGDFECTARSFATRSLLGAPT